MEVIMDNEDLYWDDIYDYEQIPCWDENGELQDDIIDAFNNIGCPNIVTTSELNKILDTKV